MNVTSIDLWEVMPKAWRVQSIKRCDLCTICSTKHQFGHFSSPPSKETRKADKLWDEGRRCAGQNFGRQTLMRLRWIFWCIYNYYDFTTPLNSKYCSICYRLAAIPMSGYDPISTPHPFEGSGWTYRGSKMVPIKMSSPHSYSTSIYTGLSCTVWPQYTRQTDRQAGRVIAIGRLCYSIGGLKNFLFCHHEKLVKLFVCVCVCVLNRT